MNPLMTPHGLTKKKEKKAFLPFRFMFCKLLLRTFFENIENNILTLSGNYSCYANLMFYIFVSAGFWSKTYKSTGICDRKL